MSSRTVGPDVKPWDVVVKNGRPEGHHDNSFEHLGVIVKAPHALEDDIVRADIDGNLLVSIETDEGALILTVPAWVMERVWGKKTVDP